MSTEKIILFCEKNNYDFVIERISPINYDYDSFIKNLFLNEKIDSSLYEISKSKRFIYALRIVDKSPSNDILCYADSFDDLITGTLLEIEGK
jgi:hypothetical protein